MPSILNIRNSAIIDSVDVGQSQVLEHWSRQLLPIDVLWLDSVQSLASELGHLINKVGSQFVKLHLLKVLQVLLIREGPDHSAAVPVLEERLQESFNSILLFDGVGKPFLGVQSLLQVLFLRDGLSVRIFELQSEVTNDPHE